MKPFSTRFPILFLLLSLLLPVVNRADDTPSAALRTLARPLEEALPDTLPKLAEAQMVLLGEASHGTSEYYRTRAHISRSLIEIHGFRFVAFEGDWNAIHQLHRYATWVDHPEGGAREIMRGFDRWPQWMWANEETAAFIEWLRTYNEDLDPEARAGVHGIDVYGMEAAIRALPDAVTAIDPELGDWVREQYACFQPYLADMGTYVRAAHRNPLAACSAAARNVRQKLEETETLPEGMPGFHLRQMSRVVESAEKHYRSMAQGGAASWNHRARHFFDTVRHLQAFYGEESRGIVWAHNTHIGDARATDMARGGQLNIGQLARDHWGREHVAAVGFGTHRGTLLAGRSWGGPRQTMTKPPAGPNTLEHAMHQVGPGNWLFTLEGAPDILQRRIGHRAAGVIYHPEREFPGNYVPTILPERYDFFLFWEETEALTPVAATPEAPVE